MKYFKILVLVATIAVVVLSFGSILSFPIYVDEILYKASLGRFAIDGIANNLMPQCGPSWQFVPPLLTRPARYLEYFFLESLNPLHAMRLKGLLAWIMTLFFTGWGLSLWAKSNKLILFVIPIFLGFTALIPVVGAMTRPECFHLFFFSLWFLVISLLCHNLKSGARTRPKLVFVLKVLLVVTAVLTATAYHRGIFFAPAILLSTTYIVFDGRWRWLGLFGSLLVLFQVVGYANQWTHCPGSIASQAYNNSLFLSPGMLLSHPISFIRTFLGNLYRISGYWNQLLYPGTYALQWMGDGHGGPKIFREMAKASLMAFIFLSPFLLYRTSRRSKNLTICFALFFFGLIGYVGLDTVGAWYRTPTIVLILVTLVFCMASLAEWNRFIIFFASLFLVLSTWSLILTPSAFRPFREAWTQHSPILKYTAAAIAQVNYEDFRREILPAALECYLANPRGIPFVIDLATYPLFASQKGLTPLFVWFIYGPTKTGTEGVRTILKDLTVTRGFAFCDGDIGKYMNIETRTSDMCCFSGIKP